ncbi:hypothetical protein AGMMS49921_12070 [Endomicrobiia bacterium]|nr:hypothetical protein AGMMS49921_12070 [Endomicrobiia bacterium]
MSIEKIVKMMFEYFRAIPERITRLGKIHTNTLTLKKEIKEALTDKRR